MSDNTETDALLTLADRIDEADERPIVIHHGAAAELRRLVAENESLKAELSEQARVHGMGGEREARLMAELEESDALRERLSELLKATAIAVRGPEPELTSWGWHDLPERAGALCALNAELVKALKHAAECVQTNYLPDKCGHDWDDVITKAEASNGS